MLDSTAFYAGVSYLEDSICYTTKAVVDEVSHKRLMPAKLKSLVESGRLIVAQPSLQGLKEAKATAERSGEVQKVSDADISVVALGIDLKARGLQVTIVSDDYSVENLAKLLDMGYSPILSKGIRRAVRWIWYCRGCGKTFIRAKEKFCDVCGTKLSRKFKKR